jgi:hypothetical protein
MLTKGVNYTVANKITRAPTEHSNIRMQELRLGLLTSCGHLKTRLELACYSLSMDKQALILPPTTMGQQQPTIWKRKNCRIFWIRMISLTRVCSNPWIFTNLAQHRTLGTRLNTSDTSLVKSTVMTQPVPPVDLRTLWVLLRLVTTRTELCVDIITK